MVITVYVHGADSEQLQKIDEFCNASGFVCKPTRGFGRPRVEVDVHKVLEASRIQIEGMSWRNLGELLGCSAGTAQRRFKELGVNKSTGEV